MSRLCTSPPSSSEKSPTLLRLGAATLAISLIVSGIPAQARAEIMATHVYHNHMPNFWPYYDLTQYAGTGLGSPIRYTYDGQVINLKNSPPANYPYYLPDGRPMPHDDLVSYYSHHAKTGAYMSWPMDTAQSNRASHPLSQTQVTMSGSVVTNVQSLNELQNVSGYSNPSWGQYWRDVHYGVKTSNGNPALDLIHFTGHHTMGPLVGNEYFLKELIYHNAILSQSYFLGSGFQSSKGFFPTELGFSERLIPVLKKLGVEWSVLGNVHLSRTLNDYPYLNDPGTDCMISPPNRADLQNTSNVGDWVSAQMFNEQQVTHNKFPFASIPHRVQYVDPSTGATSEIMGIPVEQASSWYEGYQGSVTADIVKPFEDEAASQGRVQYFVIAHDGDNSSGRAGDGGTWANSGYVTYSDSGVTGKGVAEYLRAHPIPSTDIVHVQDGSWIDTRDSSSDPTWYHWHLPFGIWSGQFSDFNAAMGMNLAPKKNIYGESEGMTVSFEYGYHYLERNFALLQAALNYAKTAEQIWLDDHPNHWRPTTTLDRQITYDGNQLNPWMMSVPIKGDASRDYVGGANPAELAWFFLLPSIDSGFGYYDENVDDHLKPTVSFNQSLHFSEPYVEASLSDDRTGPSVWWPQRYPYNPGSANKSKAEGWTLHYFNNVFGLYTYAFDVNGIADIQVKVRVHANKSADPTDKTYQVYDPQALSSDPKVDPSRVGPWVSYPMMERSLEPDINGVDWQASTQETMAIVPAEKIGNLYYVYLDSYRDQLLDYYVEATDNLGNITKSEIQQVYVGMGRFKNVSGKVVEDASGDIIGTHPFISDQPSSLPITLYMQGSQDGLPSVTLQTHLPGESWDSGQTVPPYSTSTRYFKASLSYPEDVDGLVVRFSENGTIWVPSSQGIQLSSGTWTVKADGSVAAGPPSDLRLSATVYYNTAWGGSTYIHYSVGGGAWTTAPGVQMNTSEYSGYTVYTVDLGSASYLEAVFTNGSGSWDNNGGKNYRFNPGVSTLKSGTITEGTPGGTPGNIPPIAMAGSDLTVGIGDTVSFDGSASYDPDGSIVSWSWSNGLTGARPSITYTTAGTYPVVLTVTDDAGAMATDSMTVTVVDPTEATTTLYYKRGYSTPYIHYRQSSGQWTTVPGVLMEDSQFEGYSVSTAIPLGNYDDLECVFTNGSGSWDNNGGQNYRIPAGIWTFDAGSLTEGAPGIANQPPVAMITPTELTVFVGDEFLLSGAESEDPDGDLLAYSWSTGDVSEEVTLSFAAEGAYQIDLTVTDPLGLSDQASALITVVEDPDGGGGNNCSGQERIDPRLPLPGWLPLLGLAALFIRSRRRRTDSRR